MLIFFLFFDIRILSNIFILQELMHFIFLNRTVRSMLWLLKGKKKKKREQPHVNGFNSITCV